MVLHVVGGALWSMSIRRCGQFFAAGRQKKFGIRLGKLARVKNTDSGHSLVLHESMFTPTDGAYLRTVMEKRPQKYQKTCKISGKKLGIQNITSTSS